MEKTKEYFSWTIFFIFFISFLTFVIVPFSGDEQVFLGSSRLADYFGKGLIYNSFNVWEIKGVFTRLFFYLLYKIAGCFGQCPSTIFSIALSLLYAGGGIILSWFISCNIVSEKFNRLSLTVLISSGFFAVDSLCKMQAEMTCSFLLLFSLSMALKSGGHRLFRLILSGMIISTLFWFKVPLLLLSVCFAAGFMLFSQDEPIKSIICIAIVSVSSLFSLILVGLFVYIINPDEYSRMLMASIYQGTLVSGNEFSVFSVIRSFISGFAKAMVTLPVLIIGSACLIVNYITCLYERKYAKSFYHLIVWIMPALYVMISNCYFTYHYLTFFPAAMIEIWIILNQNFDITSKNRLKLLRCVGIYIICVILSHIAKPFVYYHLNRYLFEFIGITLLVVLFLLCVMKRKQFYTLLRIIPTFAILIYFTYTAILCHNSLSYIDLQDQAYSQDYSLPMGNNEKILYLDNGVGAYYFGYDTYYEEFYPLILQRIDEGSERSSMKRYVDASKKILSYNGEYICLMDDYIFLDGKNQTLKEKIDFEYKLYKRYYVFYPPLTIFELQSYDDMHHLDIYNRKDLP